MGASGGKVQTEGARARLPTHHACLLHFQQLSATNPMLCPEWLHPHLDQAMIDQQSRELIYQNQRNAAKLKHVQNIFQQIHWVHASYSIDMVRVQLFSTGNVGAVPSSLSVLLDMGWVSDAYDER